MSFSVVVPLEELKLALRTLAKVVKKRQASEAVLSLSGEKLSISLPGASAFVPAAGTWPGVVRAPGHFFLLLSKALPTEDPVHLSVAEGRLRIASTSIPCTVDVEGDQQGVINLPVNPPLHAILHVAGRYTRDAIEHAGLMPLVWQTEERRDKLIARAAELLAPLAVDGIDLRRLVDECVRRKHSR